VMVLKAIPMRVILFMRESIISISAHQPTTKPRPL
jgi:hypothetical protein